MSLLDEVLAANSAVVERADVPVPAVPPGRRVVVVTCSEIRAPGGRDIAESFGFRHDEAFVVANAGGRVHAPDGDVARSVALALAQAGGGEAFVVAHENCAFLAADAESVGSLLSAANSSVLQAVERLCGESFISARKLAVAAAETLRASPFLPRGTPVHALVFNEGRGRLTAEDAGYDRVGTTSAFGTGATGIAAFGSPSPILGAPGVSSFGGAGPVSLFGSGPSPLMGAGSPTLGAPAAPLVAPSPDLLAAAAASFLSPPAPPTAPGFTPPSAPVGFVPPTPFLPSPAAPIDRWAPQAPPAPKPMPSPEPLTFQPSPPPLPAPPPARRPDAPPAPRKPPSDVDDPFRKAAETLERLRRERRR